MTNLHLYQPILSIPIQPHDRLKIFTLNYDGLIEILCEKMERTIQMDLEIQGFQLILMIQMFSFLNWMDHCFGYTLQMQNI